MKKLKIVYVTSEIAPYSKTGGLADVSAKLPFVIGDSNQEVVIFSPKYQDVAEGKFGLEIVEDFHCEKITIAGIEYPITLWQKTAPANGTREYFIYNKKLFDRSGIYQDSVKHTDYPDNDIRFIFFNRAVLQILQKLEFRPDIIHVNDWQTALIPAYLKTEMQDSSFFADSRTILTIHNLAYQGVFKKERYENIGLDESLAYAMGPCEFWGKINFLKAGLHYADLINTVSETYSEEIQTTDDLGCGLEGLLKQRSETLFGVVNGVDYDIWSPEKDQLIPQQFSSDALNKKYKNKGILLEKAGFSNERLEKPLIGIISRLDAQKGFDLIMDVEEQFFNLDMTFILLGTGDKKYHKFFEKIEKKYPNKVKAFLKFDNQLAHLIEAGSDIFLMPSRYEPCGLNQLYSLKYGTVPVARKTGGLADTIIDLNENRRKSTGFLFEEFTGEAMLEAINRALMLFPKKRNWNALMKRGMKQDFSWKKSAKSYVNLYSKVIHLQDTI